jgi:integrase
MYDFVLKSERYTSNYHKTKAEAKRAEAQRREELKNPKPNRDEVTATDMAFLELVNRRLDFIEVYRTPKYYRDNLRYMKAWIKVWGSLSCSEITRDSIKCRLMSKGKKYRCAANEELRLLRAVFNWGKKEDLVDVNPTDGIEFLPIEKRERYTPSQEDIDKVISVANLETQDYLWTIRDTMGRMGEINRLTWDDVDFRAMTVTLYTRKKKGGSLTPRRVPLTQRLHEILARRYRERAPQKPWVFWHRYWSRKAGKWVEGPYADRKRIMRRLCEKAGVRYFRFHPLRHAGASTLDINNAPIGAIQRILGHESWTTTEIYLHSIGHPEREAMELFELVSQKNSQPKSQPNQKSRLRLVT